jgi:hypothetical protein
MKFNDAENFIRCLIPGVARVSLKYDKSFNKYGETEVECGLIYVISALGSNNKVYAFYAPTWKGVIDKLRIHLEPKGEPTPEEEPDESISSESIRLEISPFTPGGGVFPPKESV